MENIITETMAAEFPREIRDGVFWMGACLPFHLADRVIHGHNSAYVIKGSESSMIVDTGNPSSWTTISAKLDELLGDEPLTYVFPTHPELPHTGNLPRLVEKYPDVQVVGDMHDYHLFYPQIVPNLHSRVPGDVIDLGGGQEVLIVEAMIRDLPNTQWAFARREKVLFTADGFCYMHRPELDDEDPLHLPGECALTTDELSTPIAVENAAFFTGSALYWARFNDDADQVYDRVLALVDELGVELVAPTHGNVITNVRDVEPIIRAGHKQAYRY
ncbi:MBL fold metallo-hydrolase [Microbacterium sp. ASV81]|uniref:MBL fold metallo-hydrolase n=1 Tax=Microbacterium capsulatum TaxID=3041921 RepID=A0ABU0XHT2_9MICO|nr:MBL fold metallo-hydrolase [Microbacterium sp. ASV81]MDQ4214641.1 MBL fold metallo-hydrolase [Microbacterium sp. ASV81]